MMPRANYYQKQKCERALNRLIARVPDHLNPSMITSELLLTSDLSANLDNFYKFRGLVAIDGGENVVALKHRGAEKIKCEEKNTSQILKYSSGEKQKENAKSRAAILKAAFPNHWGLKGGAKEIFYSNQLEQLISHTGRAKLCMQSINRLMRKYP